MCTTVNGAVKITGGRINLHKPSKTNESKKCWMDGFVSLKKGQLDIWEGYSQGGKKVRFITGGYFDIVGPLEVFNMIRISK